MSCLFCSAAVPSGRRKYCSYQCVKRAWYVKHASARRSTILEGPALTDATAKGLYWELYAQKLLGGTVPALKTMNGDTDLLLDDGTRIDVKSCNLYRRRMKRGKPTSPEAQTGWWVFNRNSPKDVDFFFCIGLVDDKPVKYFLIDDKHFPTSGAVISPASKRYAGFEYSPGH